MMTGNRKPGGSGSAGIPNTELVTPPQDTTLGRYALAYARKGWHVFPLRPADKIPYAGFKWRDRSTTDEDQIRKWWEHRPLSNIAIDTGKSEVVVIDIDDLNALDKLESRGHTLPDTYSVITPSGGLHYYYAAPSFEITIGSGRLPGVGEIPGIDYRGQGGYVVAPPSETDVGPYLWGTRRPPEPTPGYLRPRQRHAKTYSAAPDPGGTRYGLAALERIIGAMAMASEGTRNHECNRQAFAIGQLVAGGQLEMEPSLDALERVALRTGLTPSEVEKSIRSGFMAGASDPRGPK